jgi:exodeoxyribonuclease-3
MDPSRGRTASPGLAALSVVSWNVNSLRARLPLVLRFLDAERPDVLCLQETRVGASTFPRADFEGRGYQVEAVGAGSYAGVAIASRLPIEEVVVGLPGFEEVKSPGRRIACRVGDIWVDDVYVPTRTKIGKVGFLDALRADRDARFGSRGGLVLAGDFNICFDERDYASPALISQPQLHPARPEDLAFRRLVDGRLVDCFRRAQPAGGHFTWFPHTSWALPRNYGMRLDYVFASADLAARAVSVEHLGEPRSWVRPSDHLPVRAVFDRPARVRSDG